MVKKQIKTAKDAVKDKRTEIEKLLTLCAQINDINIVVDFVKLEDELQDPSVSVDYLQKLSETVRDARCKHRWDTYIECIDEALPEPCHSPT